MAFRLAIDAGNFARDQRGMGRVARSIAGAALDDPNVGVSFLIERKRDADGVRDAFSGRTIDVRPAHSANSRGAYDVVWFPWNGMRYGSAAPALLTVHDVFAFTYEHPQRVARVREQGPIVRGTREAAAIAAVSSWTKAETVRVLGVDPARISVIPPAPDASFFPGSGDLFMGAWRYVLLVGTREERKNARVVFDACAQAFSSKRDMLAIVGELSADHERYLRKLGVPHTVVRDPDDDTLRALYRNARVVTVPSTAEGFGLVAVEALACGAPLIAANTAALPESTGGAALLVDPSDVEAWRDAIREVLDDDALAQSLAARGAARFAFVSRERPGRAYLELLRRLARSGA